MPPPLRICGACNLLGGGVSERPKERASKARVGATSPWVQIPPPPPLMREYPTGCSLILFNDDETGMHPAAFLLIPGRQLSPQAPRIPSPRGHPSHPASSHRCSQGESTEIRSSFPCWCSRSPARRRYEASACPGEVLARNTCPDRTRSPTNRFH